MVSKILEGYRRSNMDVVSQALVLLVIHLLAYLWAVTGKMSDGTLMDAIELKYEYNLNRPHRHGNLKA